MLNVETVLKKYALFVQIRLTELKSKEDLILKELVLRVHIKIR